MRWWPLSFPKGGGQDGDDEAIASIHTFSLHPFPQLHPLNPASTPHVADALPAAGAKAARALPHHVAAERQGGGGGC